MVSMNACTFLVIFLSIFPALSTARRRRKATWVRKPSYWGRLRIITTTRGGSLEPSSLLAPGDNETTNTITSPTAPPPKQQRQQQQSLPAWKEALPVQLQNKGSKTLQKITLGQVEIYLIGTAHVSNDSSTDVALLLESVEPDCIFVELCDARIPLLEGTIDAATPPPPPPAEASSTNTTISSNSTAQPSSSSSSSSSPSSFLDKLKAVRQTQGGSRLQALSTVLLTSVQEDYANELGVELGGEFRCAHRYWLQHKQQQDGKKPHLILGDRPLSLTLVRAWESLSWFSKLKVVAGLLWSSLRKPNKEEIRKWLDAVLKEESDVLTESFQELRKHFPTLYTTIISERDAWLSAKLVQTCRVLSSLPSSTREVDQRRRRIVAIVGAGHVPGICLWLTTTTNTTPERVLRELVTTKRWAKDDIVQNEVIPMWINDLPELQEEAPPAAAAPDDGVVVV